MTQKILIVGDRVLSSVVEDNLNEKGLSCVSAVSEWDKGDYLESQREEWKNSLSEGFLEHLLEKQNPDAVIVCYLSGRVQTLRDFGYNKRIVSLDSGNMVQGADSQVAFSPEDTLAQRLYEALTIPAHAVE